MTRIGLRNAWFQAHKWIGLILAAVIIPICLTGSALVWHDAVDRMANPARFATSGTAERASADYVAAARAALPGEARISALRMPAEAGDPVTVTAVTPAEGKGRPARTSVYLDPPSARVLDIADANGGLVRVMHNIHGSLMVPGVGRQIVGWIGVAMLVSAISGLWLWWPTVGSWARGLRWRRHRNVDTNLHHLFGFWIALPLFILSLTGVWISFPNVFNQLVGEGPRPGAPRGPDRAAMMRALPLVEPATPMAAAIARAQTIAPGTVRSLTWPTDVKPEWAVTLARGAGRPGNVTIDDARGLPELAKGNDRGGTSVARWMRRIHDGTDMGLIWQMVVFLGGLLPTALAVTGVIMWWRARGWRGDLARRKKARARAAAPAE